MVAGDTPVLVHNCGNEPELVASPKLSAKELERPGFRYQVRATGRDFEDQWRMDGKITETDGDMGGYLTEAKWTGRNDAAFKSSPYNPSHKFYNEGKILDQASRLLDLSNRLGRQGVRYMISNDAGRQSFTDLFMQHFPEEMESGRLAVFHVPGDGM